MGEAFTGKAAGNWTAGGQTTWNEDYGAGHDTPVAGDTVDLNGFVIVMDVAALPVGGGTLVSITSPGTAGQLAVDLSVLGDSSINATTMTAGAASIIAVIGAAPAATLIITAANIEASNAGYGINYDSTAALIVIGSITGGSAATKFGLRNASTGSVTVTGNVTGGGGNSASGVYNASTGPVVVTGDVTGGSNANSCGIWCEGTGAVTVTGNVTGGSSGLAAGIYGKSTAVVTLNVGSNLINGTGNPAYAGRVPVWKTTGASYTQWKAGADGLTETKFAPEPDDGKIIEGTTVGTVAGAYHEATEAEVEAGVTFGDAQGLTGTLAAGGGAALGAFESGAWR